MERAYQFLNHLQENEINTQRKISPRTILSSSALYQLLRKTMHRGLVKVEKTNARSVRLKKP